MQSTQSQLKLKIWQGSKKNYDRLLTYKELEVGTIYFVGDDATFGTSKTGIIYIAVSKEKSVLFGAFDMAQLSQKVDEIERLLDEANGDIDKLIEEVSSNTEKLATIEEGAEKNKINAIERNGQAITPSEDKVINILIPIKTSELNNDSEYQTSADVAETIIGVDLNIASGIITLTRKNGTTFTIDLPTEKIIKSGYYDSEKEEIVMVLADDSEIRFSASQLIDEYYADNVTLEQYTDTADANKKKFRLTSSYKNKVDGAEQVSNKTASVTSASTATQYPSALAVWNAIKNFATSVQTFTTASTRANIESGETISEIFGKIRKWLADLKAVAFTASYNDLIDNPTLDITKEGNSDITDNTFIITSRTDGLATNKTIYRRPATYLWNYIKDNISSVLGLTDSTYNGTADKATKDINGKDFLSGYVQKLNIASDDKNDGWILVCETKEQAYMQIELYLYNILSNEESLQITININYVYKRVTGIIGNDFNNYIRVYKDGDYLRIYAIGNPNYRYRGAFYSIYGRVVLGGVSQIAINPPLGEEVTTIKRDYYRKLNDVIEITDSNLATYYNSNTEVLSGISNTIGTILINCSSRIKIGAIQMTDVFNGKRVSLIGEFVPSEIYSSYNSSVSGGFSSYLYTHRPGSPNSSLTNDTVIRGYEDFIYFNGKWYGKGY